MPEPEGLVLVTTIGARLEELRNLEISVWVFDHSALAVVGRELERFWPRVDPQILEKHRVHGV